MTVYFTPNAPVPIQPATLPMYYSWNDNALIQDRTGVLLRLADRHFLVTAEHDINLEDGRDLYVSVDNLVYHEVTARGSETIKLDIVDHHRRPVDDFVILELGPLCVDGLVAGGKHFLTSDHLRRVMVYNDEQFIMHGHPFFLKDDINVGKPDSITSSPLCWFDTTSIEANFRPADPDKLFLQYPADLAFPDGRKISNEELKGFSGCGFWLMMVDPGNPLQLIPKLVGIFNWYMTERNKDGLRWVRGATLGRVLHELKIKWPDTSNDVNGVLQYP